MTTGTEFLGETTAFALDALRPAPVQGDPHRVRRALWIIFTFAILLFVFFVRGAGR
jgi:hypothetical protein